MSEHKKVIYIAGRYRDVRGEYYVRCNIREAERAALLVWKYGGVALCPHKNTAGFGGALGIQDYTWLAGDLELLQRCDAVWATDNWRASAGAIAEVEFARKNNIPVLYSLEEICQFLGFGGNCENIQTDERPVSGCDSRLIA